MKKSEMFNTEMGQNTGLKKTVANKKPMTGKISKAIASGEKTTIQHICTTCGHCKAWKKLTWDYPKCTKCGVENKTLDVKK